MWAWALLPVSFTIWSTAGIWIVQPSEHSLGSVNSANTYSKTAVSSLYWSHQCEVGSDSCEKEFGYAMAVANGTVNITDSFPYISTCGTHVPQSCIFQQVLNIGASLVLWIVVMRFQQIRDYGCHCHLNSASLAAGLFVALGTYIVGNFQQYEAHLVGAFLAFLIGNAYFWMQTALTYKVKPKHGGCWIGPVRFLLSLTCSAFILMMVGFFTQNMNSASAVCEWVIAMVLFLLFGLFAVDFWHIEGLFFHVQKRSKGILNGTCCSTLSMIM
ncbi:modulator of macroautophagy TMEM150B-B-like [Discoglossus pictus]